MERAEGEEVHVVMSPSKASVELKYLPLRSNHPLGLLEDACMPLRAPRYATCRACEDICPVQALHVEESVIHL